MEQSYGESVMSILAGRSATPDSGCVFIHALWIIRRSEGVDKLWELSRRPAPTTRDCNSYWCNCILGISLQFYFGMIN
jgi:hypothetical protein